MATLYSREKTAYGAFPSFQGGNHIQKVYGSYSKTASLPAQNDLVIMAEGLTHDTVIHKISLTHGSISGYTDADIVLLDATGAVVQVSSADVYIAEALTFATARANAKVNTNLQKPIKDLISLGGDACDSKYSIALRNITVGSATGTLDWDIELSSPAC